MCGIAGIFYRDRNNEEKYLHLVERIVDSQHFRGPDHKSVKSIHNQYSHLIMGHNRLAIVDLSLKANQPMWDKNHRYGIIYNGMIYNYLDIRKLLEKQCEFTTSCDTEVLLQAFATWGIAALSKLNGMFAFAIYDKQEDILYLARDRFGVKPLYYTIKNDVLYFASTSKELASQLNLTYNAHYLYQGFNTWCYENQSNETAYQDLHLLPAGSLLKINFSSDCKININLIRYYDLEYNVLSLEDSILSKSQNELLALCEDQVKKAISSRLIADVPIGISLSGGVDSAVIAAFMSKDIANLSAFTLGAPSDKLSEGARVELVSQHLNLNTHYIEPKKEDLLEAFWQSLYFQDAPFPNFSIPGQYLVYKKAKEQQMKVLLGGQGGDEIFMGYRKFLLFHLQDLLQQKKLGLSIIHFIQILKNLYVELPRLSHYFFALNRYFAKPKKNSNLNIWQDSRVTINISLEGALQKRQITDVLHTSLPTLLRYEDRNSMGNSLESRLPFLDYSLVELAIALPTVLKLKNGYGKWVLRHLASPFLPDKYLFSRIKRGFDTETQRWINAGVGSSIRQYLKENNASAFLANKIKIDELYSDSNLVRNPYLLHESIILTWLVGKMISC